MKKHLIVSALIFVFFVTPAFPDVLNARQCGAIAEYYLGLTAKMREYRSIALAGSHPVYGADGRDIIGYEFKLAGTAGRDAGFMYINADRKDTPVPEFSFEGKTNFENLSEKSKGRMTRLARTEAAAWVGLDESGALTAQTFALGPSDMNKDERKQKKTYQDLVPLYLKSRDTWYTKHAQSIEKKWRKLTSAMGAGFLSIPTSPWPTDLGLVYGYYAEGYNRDLLIKQIPPHTGVNTTDNNSGCGPTAWAMMIAYHDLLWNPELLPGSQYENYADWGPEGDPNTEPGYGTYLNRLIMRLNQELFVYGVFWNDEGYTWDSDMRMGFSFIQSGLGSSLTNADVTDTNPVQFVQDKLATDHRPLIVKINHDHSCLATGIWLTNSRYADDQWLYLNEGGAGGNVLVEAENLNMVWYFRDVKTKYKELLEGVTGTTGVAIGGVNVNGTQQEWSYWVDGQSYIHECKTTIAGSYPAQTRTHSDARWNIRSRTLPSLCVMRNTDVYLAYADMNYRLKLKVFKGKNQAWEDVPLPLVSTVTRPGVCGGEGDWITLSFCNWTNHLQLLSTNLDLIKTADWRAFPQTLTAPSASGNAYWRTLSNYGTYQPMPLARIKDKTLTIVRMERGADKLPPTLFLCDKNGLNLKRLGFPIDKGLLKNTDGQTVPAMTVMNDTVFFTYAEKGTKRIRIDFAKLAQDTEGGWHLENYTEGPYLTETTDYPMEMAFVDTAYISLPKPVFTLAWVGRNGAHNLNKRILSLDAYWSPINYSGYP